MQMNVVLDRNQALNRARHYDLIYPIFWFEAGIDSLPTNLVGKLRMAQDLPPLMKKVFLVLCGLLSVVFLILLMAHSVMSWCSSSLSSLRSRSNRGSNQSSPHDTRSTTPDLDTDHLTHNSGQVSNGKSSNNRPEDVSYRSFQRPEDELEVVTPSGKLVDDHTLLPPYKRNTIHSRSKVILPLGLEQEPKKLKLCGTNSDTVDYRSSEPSECQNDYPPEYGTATVSGATSDAISKSSNSSVVSAEVHYYSPPSAEITDHSPSSEAVYNQPLQASSSDEAIQLSSSAHHPEYERPSSTYNVPQRGSDMPLEGYYMMEHKELIQAPKIIHEIPKKRDAPETLDIAPLARPEDVILPLTPSSDLSVQIIPLEGSPKNYRPLATSSPQVSVDDIKVPKLANNKHNKSYTLQKRPLNEIGPEQRRDLNNTSTLAHSSTLLADCETPTSSRGKPSRSTRPLGNKSTNPEGSPPPLESDL